MYLCMIRHEKTAEAKTIYRFFKHIMQKEKMLFSYKILWKCKQISNFCADVNKNNFWDYSYLDLDYWIIDLDYSSVRSLSVLKWIIGSVLHFCLRDNGFQNIANKSRFDLISFVKMEKFKLWLQTVQVQVDRSWFQL